MFFQWVECTLGAMRTYAALAISSLILLISGSAMAHPGHGVQEPTGLAHSMLEHPLTLGALATVAVVAGVLLLRRHKSRS